MAPARSSVAGPLPSVTDPAIRRREKLRQVRCDEIDDAHLQRLVIGQARRLAHRLLGPVGVAVVKLREAADIGDRVIGDLGGLGIGRTQLLRRVGAVLPGLFWPLEPSPPKSPTGVAAPRLVPGAIAATWQA